MAQELLTLVQKVGSAIQANVTNARAYDYPVPAIAEVPAAVVLIEKVDSNAFLGNAQTMIGTLRIVCLTGKADDRSAWLRLYDMMNTTGSGTSFIAALRLDPKFGTACDDSRATISGNIGLRTIAGGAFVGFDIRLEFMKSM